MLYWHGEDLDILMLPKLSALIHWSACKLVTDYCHMVLTFHLIYDYFTLLSTKIPLIFINIKDKLPSHPSHMHNTIHRIKFNNNYDTPLANHSKTQICYLYQVIPIWNSLQSSHTNYTSKFTFQKQIKSHLFASQS